MKVVALKKGDKVLLAKCKIANSFHSRLLGLMGKKSLENYDALVFPKCNSIHTFFMRMPIDVLFVSKEGKVLQVINSIRPWRLVFAKKPTEHTVEMQANRLEKLNIQIGDALKLEGIF